MASQVKIEKGIPLGPLGRTGMGAPRKYPFPDMEVGDSFVALLTDSRCSGMTGLQNAIWQSAKAVIGTGKIATRMLETRDGFRVWRVA